MKHIDETDFETFKQTENEDGTWDNLCVDDDANVINVLTNAEGFILDIIETGECGCSRCLN